MIPFRALLLRRTLLRLDVWIVVTTLTTTAPLYHPTVVVGTDVVAFHIPRPQQKKLTFVVPVRIIQTTIWRTRCDGRHTSIGVIPLQSSNDADDETTDLQTVATIRSDPVMSRDVQSSESSKPTTTLIRKSLKSTSKQQKKNSNGVYIRPSAAIERGSGFFVPGLEGYKVRLFVGGIVVILTVLLQYYPMSTSSTMKIATEISNDSSIGNSFAESLALFYGLLVLLQGSIEARKDILSISNSSNDQPVTSSSNGKNVQVYQQQWFIEVSDAEWRKKVEWVASTYLSLTSATDMVLIGPGKIVFSLGINGRPSRSMDGDDDGVEFRGCSAALATLAQSKSGRLSLPINHITVQTLLLPSSTFAADRVNDQIVTSIPRCVVLQRINDELCWMMVSNQLLAGFTTRDLQWLGQLALYTNVE